MAYSLSSQTKVRNLSLIHFAIAALCLIFGVLQVAAVSHWSSDVGFGIWGGFWIFLIGLLGYLSITGGDENSNGKRCLIIAHMVIAIIGAVVSAGSVFGLSIVLIDLSYCARGYNMYRGSVECNIGCGLVSCLLVLQLLEFVLAITSAAFCCSAVCCGQPFTPYHIMEHSLPASGAGGFVQVGGPAIGAQPGQPYHNMGQSLPASGAGGFVQMGDPAISAQPGQPYHNMGQSLPASGAEGFVQMRGPAVGAQPGQIIQQPLQY